jgi:seryl-tRNA synthetase
MSSVREFRTKVLFEHQASKLPGLPNDEVLTSAGGVHPLGVGLVALKGPVLRVLRFFEHEFLRLARRFGAEEAHYPVLLPMEILEDVGYLGHFPQHVTLCSHLPEDLPVLEAVAREAAANKGRPGPELLKGLVAPAHALKPAVCLPCYRHHRGVRVPDGQVLTVTMQNHVFRYEGARHDLLSRLWDFQVRDIVFMGAYPRLKELRQQVMEAAMALCRELDLSARMELANDPFFLSESVDKAVYQRLGEVKYELLLSIPHRDSQIAVSSFNLHRDYYASLYDLRQQGGAPAETACMGFGMERWVYAFLSQKGLDPSQWPERVAAWVAGYGAT